MRLPRRVPWSSIAELDQLCSWIYADEEDFDAKYRAVNRLSAWRAITHLPHALESTLSLLAAVLNDKDSISNKGSNSSSISIRQTYAAAVIRLVNGLVDPLQQGAYARSIASIAAQLGLPIWLVELRHAATHEDLPSLEVFREAIKQSLAWLLHNYFLPTIHPSTASSMSTTTLRPLSPILKQYKNIVKLTLRDSTLVTQYNANIVGIMREIERWIAEGMLASNIALNGLEWDIVRAQPAGLDSDDEDDPQEQWSLERLCEGLLEPGVLVPLSKKKRTLSSENFHPPNFSVSLWSPLLTNIQSHHSNFPSVLFNAILNQLLPSASENPARNQSDKQHRDFSYFITLARWAFWLIDVKWEDDSLDMRQDALVALISTLRPTRRSDFTAGDKAAQALLTSLCDRYAEFQDITDALSLNSFNSDPPTGAWNSDDLALMNQRLDVIMNMNGGADSTSTQMDSESAAVEQLSTAEILDNNGLLKVPSGWRLLDTQSWKACPIGIQL